jgi:hypothetical protein
VPQVIYLVALGVLEVLVRLQELIELVVKDHLVLFERHERLQLISEFLQFLVLHLLFVDETSYVGLEPIDCRISIILQNMIIIKDLLR